MSHKQNTDICSHINKGLDHQLPKVCFPLITQQNELSICKPKSLNSGNLWETKTRIVAFIYAPTTLDFKIRKILSKIPSAFGGHESPLEEGFWALKLQQPRDAAWGWSRSPAEFKATIGLTLFCSELCHLYGKALGPGHTGCSDIAGIMEQLQFSLLGFALSFELVYW